MPQQLLIFLLSFLSLICSTSYLQVQDTTEICLIRNAAMEWQSQPLFSQSGLSHSQPVYSRHLFEGREPQVSASQAPPYEHPPVPQSFHSHAGYASQPSMSSYDPDDRLLMPAAAPGSGFSLAHVQSPSPHFTERPYSSQPHDLMPVTMLAQRFSPHVQMSGLSSRSTTTNHDWARTGFQGSDRPSASPVLQTHPYPNHPQRWVRDLSRPPAVPLRQQVTMMSKQRIEAVEPNHATPRPPRPDAVGGPAEAMAQIDSHVANVNAAAGSYTRLLNAAIPPRSLPFGTTKKAEPLSKNTPAGKLQNVEEHRPASRGKQANQATDKKKTTTKASASKATRKELVAVYETADKEIRSTFLDTSEKIDSVKNDNKKRPSATKNRIQAPPVKRARTKTLLKSSRELSHGVKPSQVTVQSMLATTPCSPPIAVAVPAAKGPGRQRKQSGGSQDWPAMTKSKQSIARKARVTTATASASVLRNAKGRFMARSTIPEVGDKVSTTESATAQATSPIALPPSEAVNVVPRSTTPELVSLLREVERMTELDPSNEPSLLNAMMGLQQVEIVLRGKLQQGDLHRLTSSSGCKYLMSHEI